LVENHRMWVIEHSIWKFIIMYMVCGRKKM